MKYLWRRYGNGQNQGRHLLSDPYFCQQYVSKQGIKAPLGFLNPLLYQKGQNNKQRLNLFRDTIQGNDDIGELLPEDTGGGQPLGCCQAHKNWDLASGWGSLKIPALAQFALGAAKL